MPLLDISNLKKSYVAPNGARSNVIDVSRFVLEAGEQLAMEGASGSGKTTLLHLIAGILTPDSGRIVIAGEEMTVLSESGRDGLRARTIGYVFQTSNLLQGYTAMENVTLGQMFGRGEDEKRARELLTRVGLGDRLNYRPRQLSVGQQQRVAVARALANQPKLVLADEPTGNLDRHNAREALSLIREVCREHGAALLLVSHDQDALSQFDQVVRLDEINRASFADEELMAIRASAQAH
ncbi:MAG: ABC transporter ATP-binding protein [Acidobacteria bacterium]|nr:ABC transporter ATP-binding protein [Acidobacteriota bacterium]